MQANPINERSAKPLMITATAIFGTIGVMTHFINFPGTFIVLIRGSVSVVFLILLMAVMKYRIDSRDIGSNAFPLIASGVCLGLNWIFLFEAYKTTAISTATLCNYLTPAFVILVSPIFLRESLTRAKVVCVMAALFGMVLVSGILQNGISNPAEFIGIGEGILAAVFYTGMIIFNKKLSGIRSYDRTIVQLGIGTVIVAFYSLFALDFASLQFDTLSIVLSVTMGVVQTGIAFTLYFGTLRYLEAQTAAIYGYTEPVVSLFLSAAIIGENLGLVGWIGAALVLGSTFAYEVIVNRGHQAEPSQQ